MTIAKDVTIYAYHPYSEDEEEVREVFMRDGDWWAYYRSLGCQRTSSGPYVTKEEAEAALDRIVKEDE